MSIKYCGRNAVIINFTLTNANTWYKVANLVPGVRKWMIKSSEITPNAFDTAFYTITPTTYITNSGVGWSMDNCDLPDTYCRSTTSGTIIEILIFG